MKNILLLTLLIVAVPDILTGGNQLKNFNELMQALKSGQEVKIGRDG